MNTNALLGAIAGIVIIGGGAWYLSQSPAPSADNAQQQGAANTGSATFADIVAQGGSRSCSVVLDNPAAPATGVVYVSGTDIRADFTAKPIMGGGMEISAHMIQTGGYVYSWTDMIAQGVKVAAASGAGAAASQGFDMNAQVSYDCSPWTPDASKFAVPESVTFMEVNAQGQVQ